MGLSLYETLLGQFSSGADVNNFDEQTQTILSVMDNIQRILNSRQGATKCIPDYGLPDLSMIYQQLPSSAHTLMNAIRYSLLQYEPRLKAVEIELNSNNEDDMILHYELVCHLKEGGLVHFGTYFMPEGQTVLKHWFRR